MTTRRVSVVVATYNRADSLAVTLESLEHLAYPDFEVAVVKGPCTDRTDEVLAPYAEHIKLLENPVANVSMSRNLGIAAASGELIALIDDDAIADGRWLDDLTTAFDDPEVAAIGGPVFDPSGYRLQALICLADRWGEAHLETQPRRVDHLNHPDTWRFPFVPGSNAVFRRDLLTTVGGFDENFAFYLEEPDLCLRLIERGYVVKAADGGIVHHKSLPSGIRNQERVTVDRFPVLLSRAYFAARHGRGRREDLRMAEVLARFVADHWRDLDAHSRLGRVPADAVARFDEDVITATSTAVERASEPPRTRPAEWFQAGQTPFLPFATRQARGPRLRICVIPGGGEADNVEACLPWATALAERGHIPHVISPGGRQPAVDFEGGVWMHRLPGDAVIEEVDRIHGLSPVHAVCAAGSDPDGGPVMRAGTVDDLHRVPGATLQTMIPAEPDLTVETLQRLVAAR